MTGSTIVLLALTEPRFQQIMEGLEDLLDTPPGPLMGGPRPRSCGDLG